MKYGVKKFLCRLKVDVSVLLNNHDLKVSYLISFISIKSLLVFIMVLCRYFHNVIMADTCEYKGKTKATNHHPLLL